MMNGGSGGWVEGDVDVKQVGGFSVQVGYSDPNMG